MVKKSYISVYLPEDLKGRLDHIAKLHKIPRNRLLSNIIIEVVQDFEMYEVLKKTREETRGRVFFVDRYLDQ